VQLLFFLLEFKRSLLLTNTTEVAEGTGSLLLHTKLLGRKFTTNFLVHSTLEIVNPKHQLLSAAQWIELKRLDALGELLQILAAQSKSF
jgi:hypothetical protein